MNKSFKSYIQAKNYFNKLNEDLENLNLYFLILDKEDQLFRVIDEDCYNDYLYLWDLDMKVLEAG